MPDGGWKAAGRAPTPTKAAIRNSKPGRRVPLSPDPDPRTYYDVIWSAWELLATHCPNRVVRDLTMLLWRRSIPLRGMLLQLPGNRELMNQFLDRLLIACAARDGDAAAAIMRDSLAHTCARVLAECFIDTDHGVPVRRRPRSAPAV